jgi:hypothetical protein
MSKAEEYWQCLDVVEAREELKQVRIANFPNLEKKEKEKILKRLFKRAKLNDGDRTIQIKSFKDLARHV